MNLHQVSQELANANLICIIKFVEIYCAQKLIKAKIKMRNAKNVQMLQIIWFLIMIARPIKKDVSQQEKDVFWEHQNLYALHIQEIILLVLDILDQMEFVKVMLEVLSVEPKYVKMLNTILMNYVNNTKVVVRQMVELVFHHYHLVIHIKELLLLVLYILVLMVIAKEPV